MSACKPCAVHSCVLRRVCVCRIVVELYEVINWQGKDAKDWQLADETWECDAQRIYFYDRSEAPTSIVNAMITREQNTNAGGHGWGW